MSLVTSKSQSHHGDSGCQDGRGTCNSRRFQGRAVGSCCTAEPETVTHDDSAAEQLLSSCAKVMEMYGGPAQYLSEVLREACDGQLFLEWLKDTLPECDDPSTTMQRCLPVVLNFNFVVHSMINTVLDLL